MVLAHRIETTVQEDGSLRINNVPFHSGEKVEVILMSKHQLSKARAKYRLRGTPIEYIDPFSPVAESDWSACE